MYIHTVEEFSSKCVNLYGGDWVLVRHSFQSWHNSTDNLAGTDVYGVYDNNPESVNSWSIQFNETLKSDGSTLFMFSDENCDNWLITRNDQFTTIYDNEDRHIIASNFDIDYYAKWYNRGLSFNEDPWISVQDFSTQILYGEANNPQHEDIFQNKTSANVWISLVYPFSFSS